MAFIPCVLNFTCVRPVEKRNSAAPAEPRLHRSIDKSHVTVEATILRGEKVAWPTRPRRRRGRRVGPAGKIFGPCCNKNRQELSYKSENALHARAGPPSIDQRGTFTGGASLQHYRASCESGRTTSRKSRPCCCVNSTNQTLTLLAPVSRDGMNSFARYRCGEASCHSISPERTRDTRPRSPAIGPSYSR